MPHLILSGRLNWPEVSAAIVTQVHRWGRAVLKTDQVYTRSDGEAVLVEGVVVEFSRPLHPVAVLASHHENTIVRLWPRVAVERTRPVQHWLALLARDLQRQGAGELLSTNLADDLWQDIGLELLGNSGRR